MSNSTTDLGKESIGRLLLKLATPSIIAQLVNVLYNIVDSEGNCLYRVFVNHDMKNVMANRNFK